MQFPALTELRVSNISPHFRPIESEWLSILQSMPLLQLLALHSAVRPDTNFPLPLFDLWLPQLRFISLHSDDWNGVYAVKKLFERLQVPEACGTELGLPSASMFDGSRALLEHLIASYRRLVCSRISGGSANLTPSDIPQIEIGLQSAANSCCISFGTVKRAEVTLNWNGDRGTDGVMKYLDYQTDMFPKFPPLNIIFNNATTEDIHYAFEMARDVFSKAQSAKMHVEARPSSSPSTQIVATALPSFLSELRHMKVLKLESGSSIVLKGLCVLVPSSRRSPLSTKQGTAGFSNGIPALLPDLERLVVETGEETKGRDSDKARVVTALNWAQEFADWRMRCGFPIELVVPSGDC